MIQTFQENNPLYQNNIATLNSCGLCGSKPGSPFFSIEKNKVIKTFLHKDVRGFYVCNKCVEEKKGIRKQKLTKKQKKAMRRRKKTMSMISQIPYTTFDKSGKKIYERR